MAGYYIPLVATPQIGGGGGGGGGSGALVVNLYLSGGTYSFDKTYAEIDAEMYEKGNPVLVKDDIGRAAYMEVGDGNDYAVAFHSYKIVNSDIVIGYYIYTLTSEDVVTQKIGSVTVGGN